MSTDEQSLKAQLQRLAEEADAFFAMAATELEKIGCGTDFVPYSSPSNWDVLPEELKQTSNGIRQRLVVIGGTIAETAKHSALIGLADQSQIRLSLREMSAALRLRLFRHSDTYAITEEDRVYGMVPEEESEERTSAKRAAMQFRGAAEELIDKMDFILPSAERLPSAIVAAETPTVRRYRPNTAFIMMQINDSIPRLEDVKFCIKDVFKNFGIDAVRSDEIEHQDVLTQRILDEIATAEFLIADLTGERPSVYYEVGFAHACGKRPILYREKGTRLHFDLSVHNVPEYENVTDLRAKLTKRLEAVTNKSGKQAFMHALKASR